MQLSPLLKTLIQALTCLPGVGNKSAQRMAFHLLERNRAGALKLSHVLQEAMSNIQHCSQCRTFTEQPLCEICSDDRRVATGQLCVVESPQDVIAIEQTGLFKGTYFVLMGHLSPIDGIGPNEIGLDKLALLLTENNVTEVILATSSTVEGEATAHYIARLCRDSDIVATRLAQGVPVGGELEYIDGNTLNYAFSGRRPMS